MTQEEWLKKEHEMNISENVLEIAESVIEELQDLFPQFSRHNILQTYIYEWALEAEEKITSTFVEDYYEFIDNFAKEKLNELKNKQSKF